MSQWQTMITAVLALFSAIGLGALARRSNWLTHEADQSLLKVNINLLFPALILDATLGNKLLLNPANVVFPPLIGFVTVLVGFALALLLARSVGRAARLDDRAAQRTFALCVGIYNYSYIPLPLIKQLFGPGNPQLAENLVAMLFVFTVGVEACMWTVGVLLVSGHLGGQWYKRVLNIPTLAILIALALNFLQVPRFLPPALNEFLHRTLGLLGVAAIPLALVLIGATIADQVRGQPIARGGRIILLSSLLRLGVLPAVFLAIAWFLPASAPRELKIVLALQAAMPSAVFPIVLSRHFGGDPATAVRVVLGTSLLSLATMPLWLSFGLRWLGITPN